MQMYLFSEINDINYWIFYFYTAMELQVNSFWATGFGLLFFGFIMQIYQQLEFLASRIKELPDSVNSYLKENPKESKLNVERKCFAKLIEHHQKIFE